MTPDTALPAGPGPAGAPVPFCLPEALPGQVSGPAPARIQRRRTAGWRMPAGAVYVGRPTRWGNPYRHDGTARGRAATVAAHAALAAADPALQAAVRQQLAGRDLACWCPAGQPCHADTLLAIANPTHGRADSRPGDRAAGAGTAGGSA